MKARTHCVGPGNGARATDHPGLLKRFKQQFGAGGTISEGCIEPQEDLRDKLVEILRPIGYPAKP